MLWLMAGSVSSLQVPFQRLLHRMICSTSLISYEVSFTIWVEVLSPQYFILRERLRIINGYSLFLQWFLPGVLSAPEGANVEDEFLDPNSQLGVFLRCCILSFNTMTFEVLQSEQSIRKHFFTVALFLLFRVLSVLAESCCRVSAIFWQILWSIVTPLTPHTTWQKMRTSTVKWK
jgi:hypothetical protein